MMRDLDVIIESVQNKGLKELLCSFFKDADFAAKFKIHSAAKSIHHGFVGGLLQHTLAVTKICDFLASSYPILNRDLLVTSAICHDIGKVKEISEFPVNDYTDAGNLLGHIVMGAMMVKGRNLVDGLPKNVRITAAEVREALKDCLMTIVDAILNTLEKTPPELSADIIDNGIMLTGGGALLRGLDKLIEEETGMPVRIAERPLDCVVDGAGMRLDPNFKASKRAK